MLSTEVFCFYFGFEINTFLLSTEEGQNSRVITSLPWKRSLPNDTEITHFSVSCASCECPRKCTIVSEFVDDLCYTVKERRLPWL